MDNQTIILPITQPSEAGQRLDVFLSAHLELSRSRIKQLIEQNHVVLLPNKLAKSAAAKVKTDDEYKITIPKPAEMNIKPVKMELDIVFEDDDMLVINKAAGLTVHPAAGNYDHTLVHGLLHHAGDSLSGIGGVMRPGIVHRLDKDTSGLMVVAKNDNAHQFLSNQLADRSLKRVYHALVWDNVIEGEGVVESHIGRSPKDRKKMAVVAENKGKFARTHYKILENFPLGIDKKQGENLSMSLVECRLDTGRTHQIRVHMQHIGYPLVGDESYGLQKMASRVANIKDKIYPYEFYDLLGAFNRQALHAKAIRFIHPDGASKKSFEIGYPEDMGIIIALLQQNEQNH